MGYKKLLAFIYTGALLCGGVSVGWAEDTRIMPKPNLTSSAPVHGIPSGEAKIAPAEGTVSSAIPAMQIIPAAEAPRIAPAQELTKESKKETNYGSFEPVRIHPVYSQRPSDESKPADLSGAPVISPVEPSARSTPTAAPSVSAEVVGIQPAQEPKK